MFISLQIKTIQLYEKNCINERNIFFRIYIKWSLLKFIIFIQNDLFSDVIILKQLNHNYLKFNYLEANVNSILFIKITIFKKIKNNRIF